MEEIAYAIKAKQFIPRIAKSVSSKKTTSCQTSILTIQGNYDTTGNMMDTGNGTLEYIWTK